MADTVALVKKYKITFHSGQYVVLNEDIWKALKEKLKDREPDNIQLFYDDNDNLLVCINLDHIDFIIPLVTPKEAPATPLIVAPQSDEKKPLDNDNTNDLQSNNDTKAN